jgi:hypothetical protein
MRACVVEEAQGAQSACVGHGQRGAVTAAVHCFQPAGSRCSLTCVCMLLSDSA